jgi:exodeoxyribonuclease V alpha subunit
MSRRAPLTELTAALIDVKWRGELQPDGTQSVMLVVRPVGGVGADAGDFSSLASTELTLWLTVTPDELDTPKPDAPACLRLIRGCDYRFYGRYKDSTYRGKAEKQFTATSYGPAEQHTRESVIRYLEANGAGLGFGARRAALLYDRFGSQAVKVARLQPEVVEAALSAEKLAIPLDKLESLAARLQAHASVEDSLLELSGILRGKGFPRRLPTDLVRAKQAGAASWLKTVHFGLLQEGWPGCGFKKCDALHVSLGLPLDCLERQMFSAWHAIKVDRSGSTWFPETFVAHAIKSNIGGTDVRVEDAIQYGINGGWMTRVHTEHVNGAIVSSADKTRARMSWIAHGKNATNEQIVAEKLAQLSSADVAWPSVDAVEGVTDHQREALRKATAGAVATLIGGPGTGKSFTTAAYIKRCVEAFGEDNVAVAAPTNKAAVRLTQALRAYNIPLAAVSEHRLLGVDSVNGSSWEFRHKESRPLPYKVLFLDESSMRSLSMMANILRACRYGTHILFIGDTMQLPPIESGAPFRDMLASKVLPFGELTEPRRNAGDVVFACDDIRRGVPFRQSEKLDWEAKPPRNFKFASAESEDQQIEKLLELLGKLKAKGFDPVWDCQVIVAVNKSSKVARIPLNERLQRELNAGGEGPKGARIRTGDKVVCEENGMYEVVAGNGGKGDGGKLPPTFIAKGEFGRVVGSETAKVLVLFDGQERPVVVPFWNVVAGKVADDAENATSVEESADGGDDGGSDGEKVSLAYACTSHKMQGAEVKVAIPMIDESRGARMICTKEHFFTSISRGKVLTIPVGKESVAQEFCRRSSLTGRKTFLAELIREKVVGRMVEGLV